MKSYKSETNQELMGFNGEATNMKNTLYEFIRSMRYICGKSDDDYSIKIDKAGEAVVNGEVCNNESFRKYILAVSLSGIHVITDPYEYRQAVLDMYNEDTIYLFYFEGCNHIPSDMEYALELTGLSDKDVEEITYAGLLKRRKHGCSEDTVVKCLYKLFYAKSAAYLKKTEEFNYDKLFKVITDLTATLGYPVNYKSDVQDVMSLIKKYTCIHFILILRYNGAHVICLDRNDKEYLMRKMKELLYYYEYYRESMFFLFCGYEYYMLSIPVYLESISVCHDFLERLNEEDIVQEFEEELKIRLNAIKF